MSRMAASQLSSEDDFELIGGEVSPSSKSIGLSESSETLPTTQEVVEDDVAAPAAAEELPVQLPTSEDAAAADEDATREEGAEGAEVDDDDRSSEDDDFDERDPPRYLDLERVGARTAKMVWEADPVEVLDEAAAAAGVASERKRGPAFVVQIAEDSFWASWGDPVACADNCVRFVELTPSTAFVVRVARCIAAADDVEEGDDEDQLVSEWSDSYRFQTRSSDEEADEEAGGASASATVDDVRRGEGGGSALPPPPPPSAADSGAPLVSLVTDPEGTIGDVLDTVAERTVAGLSSVYDVVGSGLSFAGTLGTYASARASALVDTVADAVDSVAATVAGEGEGEGEGADEEAAEAEAEGDLDGKAGVEAAAAAEQDAEEGAAPSPEVVPPTPPTAVEGEGEEDEVDAKDKGSSSSSSSDGGGGGGWGFGWVASSASSLLGIE